jgi:hypothetical protein
MTSAGTSAVERAMVLSRTGILAYEAPFLIEKLLKDQIVETAEEAAALFAEVKRYFILVRSDGSSVWQMHSLRIDEVWHQFVLFTPQYMDFCERFLGGYIPHSPGNAPEHRAETSVKMAPFPLFRQRYEELFGAPLPDLWYDERSVTTRRRILNERAGSLALRDDNGMVDLVTDVGDVLLSVNDLAREALAFVARTGAFYVRELPGDLDDEEKIALVATLVENKILRVGS